MARVRLRKKLFAEINIVPYVDVMLVLLVIFMITTPLLTQGVKVQLPQAQANAMTTPTEPIIVTVDQFGRLYLNISNSPNKPMAPNDLAVRVAAELVLANQQHKTAPPVMVRGDQGASYGKVVAAMVLLQQAGVNGIGLLTDPTAAS